MPSENRYHWCGQQSRVRRHLLEQWNHPPPEANIWTAFTNPLDVHYWELTTPSLNTCARNGIDANGDGQFDDVNGDGVVNSWRLITSTVAT